MISLFADPEKSTKKVSTDAQPQPNTTTSPEPFLDVRLPESQTKLVAATSEFSSRFSNAKNELQESLLRDERKSSIINLIAGQFDVDGWHGEIVELETNTDGKAILTVKISQNTTVGTWNNALSDVFDNTLIEKSSPLYAALLSISVGDKVRFSGSFIPSDEDGIREQSLTINGSMTNPEFLFRFSGVTKE